MADILADICDRLSALETIVLGARKDTTDPHFDRRLTKREVAMRRGKSTRTIDRDVERGVLPPAEVESGRSYWWLGALRQHERTSAQPHTKPKQPPQFKPRRRA